MKKQVKNIALLLMLSLFLSACIQSVTKTDHGRFDQSSGASEPISAKAPSDRELYEEALSCLKNAEKDPDYLEAKRRLEDLLNQHPQSSWASTAQSLIVLIEKITGLQAKMRQEKQKTQADHAKMAREVENLKEANRLTDEKYAAELARLQQENEQLKNDIQQLKRLEVQLERREKMLR
jgi:vacuolar-type H+-ATPase subunit I/STV1